MGQWVWFWFCMGWGGAGRHLQPGKDIYKRNINLNSSRKILFPSSQDGKSLACAADTVVRKLAAPSRFYFKRG